MQITTEVENGAAQEVAQNISQRLRTFQGEWFLEITIGVPYLQQIFTKGIDAATVEGLLKREILSTPFVKALTSFTLTLNNSSRVATCTFSVDTTFGATSGEVTL
jgi:hypothetical protein